MYLDPTRAHLVTERAIEGPPTLVVEILSPSTTRIDRVRKRELYAQYGIPYYWIVDRSRDARGVRSQRGLYALLARASGADPGAAAVPGLPRPTSLWP